MGADPIAVEREEARTSHGACAAAGGAGAAAAAAIANAVKASGAIVRVEPGKELVALPAGAETIPALEIWIPG